MNDLEKAAVSYFGLPHESINTAWLLIDSASNRHQLLVNIDVPQEKMEAIYKRQKLMGDIPGEVHADLAPRVLEVALALLDIQSKMLKQQGDIGAAVKQMAEQINVLTANGTATFDMPAPQQQEEEEPAQPEQPEAQPLPDLQEVMRNPEKYIGREDCRAILHHAAVTSRKVRQALSAALDDSVGMDGCKWVSVMDMNDEQLKHEYDHAIHPSDKTAYYRVPVDEMTDEQKAKYCGEQKS